MSEQKCDSSKINQHWLKKIKNLLNTK